MENSLLNIAYDYFSDKKSKNFKSDEFYINEIKLLGFDDELAKNIFIKIDDEWTLEEHNIFAESKVKKFKVIGLLAILLGLFLSIYSIFYIQSISIYFYGAILGGIISYFYSGTIMAEINKNRKVQQLEINRMGRINSQENI